MKATFENTVDILVKAYLNDTLIHSNCTACAVGNIIRGSGYPMPFSKSDDDKKAWNWLELVRQKSRKEGIHSNYKYDLEEGKRQIESTGYSMEEVDKIENAFELVSYYDDRDERMYKGLMAVVDVLAEIHNVDLTVKENAKLLFVKP